METYEAKLDGQTRRVTVPEDPKPDDILTDALRDSLSPKAVVAIVAFLQPASTNDPAVNREVAWFTNLLVDLVADDYYDGMVEELGL